MSDTTPLEYAERLRDRLESEALALHWLDYPSGDDPEMDNVARSVLDDYSIDYDDDAAGNLRQALSDSILSIEREVVLDITYATGGPAYGVRLTYCNCGDRLELDRAESWGQDWYTPRVYCKIPDSSDAWHYLSAEFYDYANGFE